MAQKSRADLEDEVQGLRQQWDETLRQAQLQRGDLQGRCQDLQKEVLGKGRLQGETWGEQSRVDGASLGLGSKQIPTLSLGCLHVHIYFSERLPEHVWALDGFFCCCLNRQAS